MADSHHLWVPGKPPPVIRPHSLAKHRVIEGYLRRYVEVLNSNPKFPEFRLTLVDGFAGGGLYRDSISQEERFGSPLLMLRAMHDSAAQIQSTRENKFHLDAEYFFVEKSQSAVNYLTDTLRRSDYSALVGNEVKVIHGEFVDQVDRIVSRIDERGRGKRAIFVLDQCGYAKVPIPAIRNILERLDNAEIILTFATDSLIDYLGQSPTIQKILKRVGVPISPQDIKTMKEHHDWRRAIQIFLHREIHEQSGARFYTPFFIRSKDAHRDFWLIHLSGHARARDVMVAQHWKENTSFAHYGRSGLRMLGYDPDEDFTLTGQNTLPGFFFDETAEASCHDALLGQVPDRLPKHSHAISFDEFFSNLTNETPATSEHLKHVLADLVREGVIEVRDRTGEKLRQVGVRQKSDLIIRKRQKRLSFPKSPT